MKLVRAATIEDVLLATPDDEPTRNIVRARPEFGVWSFDRQDIGNIGAQLPSGKMGTVSSCSPSGRSGSAHPIHASSGAPTCTEPSFTYCVRASLSLCAPSSSVLRCRFTTAGTACSPHSSFWGSRQRTAFRGLLGPLGLTRQGPPTIPGAVMNALGSSLDNRIQERWARTDRRYRRFRHCLKAEHYPGRERTGEPDPAHGGRLRLGPPYWSA